MRNSFDKTGQKIFGFATLFSFGLGVFIQFKQNKLQGIVFDDFGSPNLDVPHSGSIDHWGCYLISFWCCIFFWAFSRPAKK